MIFEFGQYRVDADVDRTRLFYEKAKLVSEQCSCEGCQNFAKAAQFLPESVKAFFSKLGVDLRRISECYVYHANADGSLSYGGICHICGSLLSGATHPGTVHTEELFFVSPDFQIDFSEDISLLEEDFPSPVIQLHLYAKIPWMLEIENSYYAADF